MDFISYPLMGVGCRACAPAHGPQQVNNFAPTTAQNAVPQSKLMGKNDGERMDPGTPSAAGEPMPRLAQFRASPICSGRFAHKCTIEPIDCQSRNAIKLVAGVHLFEEVSYTV